MGSRRNRKSKEKQNLNIPSKEIELVIKLPIRESSDTDAFTGEFCEQFQEGLMSVLQKFFQKDFL